MKAAVFAGEGRLELRDVPDPVPAHDDDVLVRVDACGICGSDLRALAVPPAMDFAPGVVMGHELVGEVLEAGARADVEPGTRVTVLPNVHCGSCAYCRREQYRHCERFEHVGATRDGAFAERCVVPARFVHRVPDGLDPRVAALAEPLACVLNGTRRAGWHPGTSAAVLGAGPIGLLFALVARLAGVRPLIVSEPMPARAEWARRIGTDVVVDPTAEPLDEAVRAVTGGVGVDVVFDAVGTLLPDALGVLRKGGRALVFGLDATATATVRPHVLTERELRVEGVYITNGTFPLALTLLRQHADLFGQLVTHTVSLDRIEDGIAAMRSGEAVKAVVRPNAVA